MSEATCGLGGLGLLIAPVCPCRAMVTEDDELVIAHGTQEVARFIPGAREASGDPTWHTPRDAQFGEGGPMLSIADHLRFEDVFLQIDAGLPDAPWCALGPGFMIDLPAGVILLTATPGDEDPHFELHLQGGNQEYIKFAAHPSPPQAVTIKPAPYQQLIARDHLDVQEQDGSTRKLAYTELGYEHEGAAWKQLAITVPLHGGSMIVSAQARVERANELFRAAGHVAATLGPLG